MFAHGSVGHGSKFIENTAASKLYRFIDRMLQFRQSEENRLKTGLREDGQTPLTLGDVTTVNWTMSSGGVQYNVVPDYMEVQILILN